MTTTTPKTTATTGNVTQLLRQARRGVTVAVMVDSVLIVSIAVANSLWRSSILKADLPCLLAGVGILFHFVGAVFPFISPKYELHWRRMAFLTMRDAIVYTFILMGGVISEGFVPTLSIDGNFTTHVWIVAASCLLLVPLAYHLRGFEATCAWLGGVIAFLFMLAVLYSVRTSGIGTTWNTLVLKNRRTSFLFVTGLQCLGNLFHWIAFRNHELNHERPFSREVHQGLGRACYVASVIF